MNVVLGLTMIAVGLWLVFHIIATIVERSRRERDEL